MVPGVSTYSTVQIYGATSDPNDRGLVSKIFEHVECINEDFVPVRGRTFLPHALLEKLTQQDFSNFLVNLFIDTSYPEVRSNRKIIFDVTPGSWELADVQVVSNLNFERMRELYLSSPAFLKGSQVIPHWRPVPHPGNILNLGLITMCQTVFALKGEGDIILSPNTNAMAYKLIDQAALQAARTADIELFQQYVLNDSRAISSALNSGERTYVDLFVLLSKRNNFQTWQQEIERDHNLLSAYIKEVSSQSWIEKLPAKMTRFGFFTGAGILADLFITGGMGTTAGVAAGAFDCFVLDRLVRGPPPSKFVNGPLKKFAATK